MKSFISNFCCRFCLIHKSEINIIFSKSHCTLRTLENYLQHTAKEDVSRTGVTGIGALSKLIGAHVIDIMTVDFMHDILEGALQHEFGLLFNFFIEIKKYFTCQQLNNRIDNLFYGPDEIRSKPCHVSMHQIKQKYVKMSACETLSLF